jgi:hypothetical protein
VQHSLKTETKKSTSSLARSRLLRPLFLLEEDFSLDRNHTTTLRAQNTRTREDNAPRNQRRDVLGNISIDVEEEGKGFI